MADKTEVDYDQLQNFAKLFESEAEEIQALTKQTDSSVEDLSGGGWVGRGSDAFYAEMNDEVIPAMLRAAKALQEAGRVTKQIAEIFNQAEEESQSNFNSLG